MRPHTRLALGAAVAFVAVVAVVDVVLLPWAAPVLPLLAAGGDRVRWTDLATLRVVQLGAAGQALAVTGALLGAWPVTGAGVDLVGLAALVTGYGLVRFPR
ncbi:hypothetical protein GCM10023148_50790 [Actinokineospora soli]